MITININDKALSV